MAEKQPKPTRDPKKGIAIARWENEGGALREKKPKRPRDINQWAKRMVDIATGEVDDEKPNDAASTKERASKGGVARARALKPKQRTEIAKKAAAARWSKDQEKSDA